MFSVQNIKRSGASRNSFRHLVGSQDLYWRNPRRESKHSMEQGRTGEETHVCSSLGWSVAEQDVPNIFWAFWQHGHVIQSSNWGMFYWKTGNLLASCSEQLRRNVRLAALKLKSVRNLYYCPSKLLSCTAMFAGLDTTKCGGDSLYKFVLYSSVVLKVHQFKVGKYDFERCKSVSRVTVDDFQLASLQTRSLLFLAVQSFIWVPCSDGRNFVKQSNLQMFE